MTYNVRQEAINIAREIDHHGNIDTLLENARRIEEHLLGLESSPAGQEPPVPKIDFDAELPEAPADLTLSQSKMEWSGVAHDLVKTLNRGSTIISKARQIGMTTFLCAYVAHKTQSGKDVLWMAPNYRSAINAQELIQWFGGDVTKLNIAGLNNSFDAIKGRYQDLVVVDGLAYLPYGKETEFAQDVLILSKHHIFASEPAQKRGLFYDIWRSDNPSFEKIALMWNTPLRPFFKGATERLKAAKVAIGLERFRSEYECVFREIKD